jgi:hypothetical protein
MFYRFNTHKEKRVKAVREAGIDAAQDKVARRIAARILRLQRRWADGMGKWVTKMPVRKQRILLIVGFAASVSYAVSLIVRPLPVQSPSLGKSLKAHGTAAKVFGADSASQPVKPGSVLERKP